MELASLADILRHWAAETPDAAQILARAGLSDAPRDDDDARVRESALPFLRAAPARTRTG